MKEKKKKRPASGDFVTVPGTDGSWMVTETVFNYELNVYQARISKVGNPRQVEFVDPETLSVIETRF